MAGTHVKFNIQCKAHMPFVLLTDFGGYGELGTLPEGNLHPSDVFCQSLLHKPSFALVALTTSVSLPGSYNLDLSSCSNHMQIPVAHAVFLFSIRPDKQDVYKRIIFYNLWSDFCDLPVPRSFKYFFPAGNSRSRSV